MTTALDQIWKLTNEKASETALMCETEQFGPEGAVALGSDKPSVTLVPFAVCTLGGRPIPDVLLSSGMLTVPAGSPPLRLTTASSQPLPGYGAKYDTSRTTDANQDAKRTTLLAIQGWMATILGFGFASLGIFIALHDKSAQATNYRSQAITDMYAFKRLIRQIQDNSGTESKKLLADAAKRIKELEASVSMYVSHEHITLSQLDRGIFEHIHQQLSQTPPQLPDPMTLNQLIKTVEGLL